MKITDRINTLQGVKESKYNFDGKTIYVRYNSSADFHRLQITVAKIVSDLQLNSSIERIVFQNDLESD